MVIEIRFLMMMCSWQRFANKGTSLSIRQVLAQPPDRRPWRTYRWMVSGETVNHVCQGSHVPSEHEVMRCVHDRRLNHRLMSHQHFWQVRIAVVVAA